MVRVSARGLPVAKDLLSVLFLTGGLTGCFYWAVSPLYGAYRGLPWLTRVEGGVAALMHPYTALRGVLRIQEYPALPGQILGINICESRKPRLARAHTAHGPTPLPL
jgi:hypothetical protein